MHLNALSSKIEVAVVLEEPQETFPEVLWFIGVVEIADDQANYAKTSDAARMNLVEAMHNEELLHKSYHVYLCECAISNILYNAHQLHKGGQISPKDGEWSNIRIESSRTISGY